MKKLHNRKLHNFYSSPDIIREIKSSRMTLTGILACMGEMRNAYNILVGMLKRKRPLRRPRCRWENIKTGLVKCPNVRFL
jgi:hypothetical protein